MTITLGPHRTFDEQAAAGVPDITPCACWLAGNGQIGGLDRTRVQHPGEFDQGVQSALEEALDL